MYICLRNRKNLRKLKDLKSSLEGQTDLRENIWTFKPQHIETYTFGDKKNIIWNFQILSLFDFSGRCVLADGDKLHGRNYGGLLNQRDFIFR